MKIQTKELVILAVLVVLCVVSAIINPNVYKPENLQNTGRLIGIYGIFSLGMMVVIITGGIDLSVGSVFAFLGVILSMALTEWHVPPFLALIGVIAAGAVIGAINGLLITRVKLQPFVATLCGLLTYRGMARFMANDETKGFGDASGFEWMRQLASGNVGSCPTPLVLLAITSVIFYLLLHRSVFGRYLFAVGRNEEAARFAGVNVKRVTLLAYVICGVTVGMATVLFAFYTNSISASSHGNFYELYAIAAAVLGGCSLRGGEGTVLGVLLGIALLQILRNLVNLLHVPSSLEFAVMGIVILGGVVLDSFFRSRERRVTV
jgi:ribose transport system permease protein